MIIYITSCFFSSFSYFILNLILKISTLNTKSENIYFIYTPSPYLGEIIVILVVGVLQSIADTKPRDELAF